MPDDDDDDEGFEMQKETHLSKNAVFCLCLQTLFRDYICSSLVCKIFFS